MSRQVSRCTRKNSELSLTQRRGLSLNLVDVASQIERLIAIFFVVAFVESAVLAQAPQSAASLPNHFYATQTEYHIDIPSTFGGNIKPGGGIDMSQPENPILRNVATFSHTPAQQAGGAAIPASYIANTQVSYQEASSDFEEAHLLNTYFKGSFGFADFQAAYDKAQQTRSQGHSIYVLISVQTATDSVFPTELTWTTAPRAEAISDLGQRWQQFVLDYGTHYIFSVTYGYRVAIRATLNSLDSSQFEAFAGSVHGRQTVTRTARCRGTSCPGSGSD